MNSNKKAQGSASRKQNGSKASGKREAKKTNPTRVALIPPRSAGYPSLAVSKVSPYERQLIQQLVAPGTVGGSVVVSPSRGSKPVCARHIHFEKDVKYEDYPDGFVTVVSPDFEAPAYISNKAAALFPEAPGKLVATGNMQTDKGSGPVSFSCKASTSETDDKVILTAVQTTADGKTWYGLQGNFTRFSTGLFGFKNTSSTTCVLTVEVACCDTSDIPGTFSPLGTVDSVGWTKSGEVAFTIPIEGCDRLLFRGSGATGLATYSFDLGLSEAQFALTANNSMLPSFARFVTDHRITDGRVLAASVLLTNTSNALAKGGTISVGRVPSTFDAWGNIDGAMSELPSNRRHMSAAEFGGYAFWCPADLDEFEINDVASKAESYEKSDYLIAHVLWQEGASFRIQYDWIVEFYTPNQLFDKTVPPPITSRVERILKVLAEIPAATCNPEHENKLKQALESVTHGAQWAYKNGKAVIDHIDKYGPYYAAAAEILMSLL